MVTTSLDPAGLADALHATGDLPATCGPAFLAIRREDFIPDRMWLQAKDGGPYEPVERTTDPGRWRAGVYGDHVIATQFDDGATVWPDVGTRPTCSASMPSAVAGMLAELGAQPGEHVVEIGAGTGFNAALVGSMVGPDGQVTTLEVDAELAHAARANLSAADVKNVTVVTADALAYSIPAGVDRVIVTAGVQAGELPYNWVENTRPGGVIVAPMRTHLSSGPLVRFEVTHNATAYGRASSRLQVGFMQLRSQRVNGAIPGLRWDDPAADVSYTDVEPWPLFGAADSRWPIAMALPRCVYDLWEKTEERRGVAWLRDPLSGSWATVTPDRDRFLVRQYGPRRLWDVAEAAHRWWLSEGSPRLEDWVWTVEPTRQSVIV